MAPTLAPGPTLAAEDTLSPSIAGSYPEILVNAPRARLDEILRWVAEGETRRDSLMRDQAYTVHVRMAGRESAQAPADSARLLWESATRLYKARPDRIRVIRLRERSYLKETGDGKDGDRASIQVNFGADMSETFVLFAFDPQRRSRYRYQIEERSLVGDHLIYRIGFTPRSGLELLPSGRVWIDTNDFVIVREEFWYRDRSPAPLLLRSIDSCVLERTRIDRRYWVVSRILARVTLADPVRWLGRLAGERYPRVCDFVLSQEDWIINGGIPDSIFVPERPEPESPR